MSVDTALVQVERELERLVEEAHQSFRRSRTEQIHAPLLQAGGKLLRPRLLLLCTSHGAATGDDVDWGLARRAGLAIELAHVGTLYHDDLVDRSPTRRGLPAVHRRLDSRSAALGGAHLLALANALAARLPDGLARRWGVAALQVAEGQLRETERTGMLDLSPEEYLRIARKKTASLFELAAFFGASIGGADDEDRLALERFARHLGTAFQLFDDLDDFVSPQSAHRPSANDLRERVYTLPVLFGCAREDPGAERVRELLADDGRPLGNEVIAEVRTLLTQAGAFRRAHEWAHRERNSAHRWLARARPSPARASLAGLLSRLGSTVACGTWARTVA